ncbi:MAG TPA: hypothetical protein VN397_03050 [Candidatus Methylomirabilis sp.]|nr:hypothetical protein [Candidatus Methylomirabilis sp.]
MTDETTEVQQGDAPTEASKPFQTELGTGRDGFLSHVIVKGLELGERTPEDFIRHFSPMDIMIALIERPILRANILVEATGTKEKTALKKTAESAGGDLQIALDEGDTTCAEIVQLFQPDERVRYLNRAKLWEYATEGKFWMAMPMDVETSVRAKTYLAFIIDCAIANLLVTHEQVVAALTVDRLARDLPKEELGKIIAAALKDERKFTEETFLSAVPPESLVKHISLPYIWEKVVHPLVAEQHNFVERPKESEPAPSLDVTDFVGTEECDGPKA